MSKSPREILSHLSQDNRLVSMLSGSSVVLLFKVLGAVSGYAFAFIAGKLLGPESFGTYELGFTALMILGTFGRLGLDGVLVKFLSEWRSTNDFGKIRFLYRRIVLHGLGWSLLLGVGLYILAPFIGPYFGGESLVRSFRSAALGLPFFLFLTLNIEAMRGFKKMVAFSIFQNGTVLLLASGVLYLGISSNIESLSLPMNAFVLSLILVSILSGGVYFSIQRRVIGKPAVDAVPMRGIYQIALPMLVSGALFYIISWTDVLMIGYIMDERSVGIYRIAFKIGTLITFTQFAINSFLAPAISELHSEGGGSQFRRLIRQVGVINFWMSVPVALIIFVFPNFLLNLFGPEYPEALDSLRVLAIGQLINALCGPVLYILNMTGKEKDSQRIMLWVTLVNIVLNGILIPMFGILGAAIATSVSMSLWNIAAVIKVVQYYSIWPVSFLDKILGDASKS
ncbi:MAG: lipopolysaccharide biosynthesis protein [Schleiferiaceae bacterium]